MPWLPQPRRAKCATNKPPSLPPPAAAASLVQLPGRCTALYTSVFMTNLLPGGSMDPQKQPDGSFSLFMPVGQAKVSGALSHAPVRY